MPELLPKWIDKGDQPWQRIQVVRDDGVQLFGYDPPLFGIVRAMAAPPRSVDPYILIETTQDVSVTDIPDQLKPYLPLLGLEPNRVVAISPSKVDPCEFYIAKEELMHMGRKLSKGSLLACTRWECPVVLDTAEAFPELDVKTLLTVPSLRLPYLHQIPTDRRLPTLLGGQLEIVSRGAPVEGLLVLQDTAPKDYDAMWRLTRLQSGLAHMEREDERLVTSLDAVFDALSPPQWITEAKKESGDLISGQAVLLKDHTPPALAIVRVFVHMPWQIEEMAVLEKVELRGASSDLENVPRELLAFLPSLNVNTERAAAALTSQLETPGPLFLISDHEDGPDPRGTLWKMENREVTCLDSNWTFLSDELQKLNGKAALISRSKFEQLQTYSDCNERWQIFCGKRVDNVQNISSNNIKRTDEGPSLTSRMQIFEERSVEGYPLGSRKASGDLSGIVCWTGALRGVQGSHFAVLEVDTPHANGSDGDFFGQKLCSCRSGCGFLVSVEHSLLELQPTEANRVPPICDLTRLCGLNKGIQGAKNSCYLDSLLFALFAFETVFEDMVRRAPDSEGHGHKARQLLLEEIVRPLRVNHFVPSKNIRKLRKILANDSGQAAFLSESRDIPECMEWLFQKLIKVEHFVVTGEIENSPTSQSYTSSFSIETLPLELPFPTSQLALEFSVMTMQFRVKEVPNILLLQLPRSRNEKQRLLVPSLTLNFDHCLASLNPQSCASCGEPASFTCPELFAAGGMASTYLCRQCAHLHPSPSRPMPPSWEQRRPPVLHLSAILCIERSHFNCFARCHGALNEPSWVFFDSMWDQQALNDKRVNVPRVERADVDQWIRKALLFKRLKAPKDCNESIYERFFHSGYTLIYTRDRL